MTDWETWCVGTPDRPAHDCSTCRNKDTVSGFEFCCVDDPWMYEWAAREEHGMILIDKDAPPCPQWQLSMER